MGSYAKFTMNKLVKERRYSDIPFRQQLEWFCSTIKTNNRGAYESCQKKDRGVVIQTKMSNVSA
ncbi:hypothetical protein L917_00125 [Phytophthora nicotianae]|uniref:Uncharacterized protein n=1 Tax=Phytophthora nicotianae TaxID=4792 RepID=W2M438_PHYNI|nr:hypothetical protein L917_00125 [Phytophthora nicotianae]